MPFSRKFLWFFSLHESILTEQITGWTWIQFIFMYVEPIESFIYIVNQWLLKHKQQIAVIQITKEL